MLRYGYIRKPTKRQTFRLAYSLALLIVISVLSLPAVRDKLGLALQQNQPGLYQVTQFVDGDTIEIDMNGHTEKVRLIGVDTPETHDPRKPVQCYGPEASDFTKNTIGQSQIRLEADPLNTDRDRYDRLLRYVYLPDGRLLNQLLIEQGYGFYYPYFPFSNKQAFSDAQLKAQTQKIGLWANCWPIANEDGGYSSNPLN